MAAADFHKKDLTQIHPYAILAKRVEDARSFFCAQKQKRDSDAKKILVEVEVVRVKITLACTECKQRNYNMTKDKKTHPDRMETKKYCRFCKKHTSHKETQ